MNTATKISLLWIFVMFNMAFADILGFMYPGALAKISSGTIDGVTVTPTFLLIAAVLVEVGIAMIYLSRVLPRAGARIANLIAVPLTIAFVIGGGSLALHYIFFASLEVIAMLYIGYLALSWRD